MPIWAERAGPMTRWHPDHIAERYGLFTLIVLGEVILAATTAIQAGLSSEGVSAALLSLAGGGLLLVFGLWWVYFLRPAADGLRETPGNAFVWGYGHYVVFAAVGALGAGLEVAVQSALHEAHAGPRTAAFAVAVPVAVTLLVIAGAAGPAGRRRRAAGPATRRPPPRSCSSPWSRPSDWPSS